MKKNFRKLLNLRWQGLVQYALLISLLVVGAVLVLNLFGISVSDVYCNVSRSISNSQEVCAAEKIYCEDTFDGSVGGWKPVSGTAKVSDGQMCLSNYMQTLNQCSMKSSENDYVINMNDVVLTQGNGYGVYFRSTLTNKGLDGYVFQYDPGATGNGNKNGYYLIRRWVGGVEVTTPIAIAPMSGKETYNVPHDIKIVVNGDSYTVFMDGKQILSAKDSTYPTGGSGLRSWDSTNACLGDFSIGQVLR